MSRLLQLVIRNNYIFITIASVAPLLWYASRHSPTSAQLEAALEEEYAERVAKSRQLQSSIGTFWRDRRSTREMDEVYDTLLRSGNSSPTKRHYELTGTLAQEEARRDPQYARTRALLQGVGAEGSISTGGGEGRAREKSGTPGGGAQGGGERAPERGGSEASAAVAAAGGRPAPAPVLPER